MIPRNSQIVLNEREMMSGNTAHDHGPGGEMSGVSYSQLLAPGHADVQAVQAGPWSSGSTWSTGQVPQAGQNIHIPRGRMVEVDVDDAARELGWIRNDGGLRFSSQGTVRLTCDAILNTLTSYLEIGNPVAAGRAEINWIGGAMDPLDTMEMGRGLLTIGRVMIRGEKVIPYAMLPISLPAGSTSFTLPDQYSTATGVLMHTGAEVAATWRAGHQLYFERQTSLSGSGAETATIQSISGATVTLTAPLQFNQSSIDHNPHGLGPGITMPPGATFPHRHNNFVINETRTVRFRSLDPGGVRGHAMIMHGRQIRNTDKHFRPEDHIFVPTYEQMGDNADPGVDFRWASFEHMGRTRTIGTPKIGDPGNQVGRYSWHAHRLGHWAQRAAIFQGLHVHGNVGWGGVRHDSHVDVDYCTVRGQTGLEPAGTNGGGAGFMDEEDTEFGHWTRCMTACVNGSTGRVTTSNNEMAFNGHGHQGDAFAINRNNSVRELHGLNCRFNLNFQPPMTNTRNNGASVMTAGFPTDRKTDLEGVKRTGALTNPLAFGWNEDFQPFGWYGCHYRRCTGLRVFHRQRAYSAADMHIHVKDMVGSYGRPLDTQNYVHNYMFQHGSWHCNNGSMWIFGDKTWGFVLVQNYAWDIGPNIEDNWGQVSETYNVTGGLANNVFIPRTSTAWPTGLAMDTTNHDSTNWAPYTFTVEFHSGPYGGVTGRVRARITDGFTGNVPLHLGRDAVGEGAPSGSLQVEPMGPKPLGYGRHGLHNSWIDAVVPGPSYILINQVALTDYQMVYTHGCIAKADGTGHVVPLYFPFRDRLTGTLHWARTEWDVTHLPLAYRQKYLLAADPGHPTFPEIPPLPADEIVTSYNVFLDPTHPVIYVEKNGRIQVDASEAFLDLPVGQSASWTRTITRANGQTETINFTVPGRAYAPSTVYAPPKLSRQGKVVAEMPRGPNQFGPALMEIDKGRANGWPAPYTVATVLTSRDAKATWQPHPANLGLHDLYIPPPVTQSDNNPPQGWREWAEADYRQEVRFTNPLGELVVPSNTLRVNGTNATEVAGNVWDAPQPAVATEPNHPAPVVVTGPAYPTMLTGMYRPADIEFASPAVPRMLHPTWHNGVMTQGEPSLITTHPDRSQTLNAQFMDNDRRTATLNQTVWNSGKLQMIRPRAGMGRWSWVASSDNANAVLAMFTYASSQNAEGIGQGSELDFEYGLIGGNRVLMLTVHMPRTGGGRASVGAPHVPFSAAQWATPRLFEIEHDADRTRWFIDGALVGTVERTAMLAQFPDAVWTTTSLMEPFSSVERHASWAGWTNYTTASMRVYGLKAPGM